MKNIIDFIQLMTVYARNTMEREREMERKREGYNT